MRAEAKVNLALAITGRRPDGYHTLHSVFLRLSLADDLSVRPADDPAGPDLLRVEGDPDCPVEDNLVLRAAAMLREHVGVASPALSFGLRKRVPMAAGLGGGSSDAAAALELAARAWGHDLDMHERLGLALRLGADVPFFAAGHRAAEVTGIGGSLAPLPPPTGEPAILLVVPPVRSATADVFGAFDRWPPSGSPAGPMVERLATLLLAGLDGGALVELADELRDANDLWPAAAAVEPTLPELRAALEARLARPVLLTGSGAALFAIYASLEAARTASQELAVGPVADMPGGAASLIVTGLSREEDE